MQLLDKYKYVIWDWNGTIFNDVKLCVDVGNNLFKKKDKNTISIEKYRSIFTIPVKDYYIAVGFDFTVDSFEEIGKEWMDEYEERKYECSLYEHLPSVMKKLKENGVDQSVVSAYKQDRLIEMIEEFGLNDYLNHIVGLDNIYAAGKLHLAKSLIHSI
jgi:phosphoglycolate phosphatase